MTPRIASILSCTPPPALPNSFGFLELLYEAIMPSGSGRKLKQEEKKSFIVKTKDQHCNKPPQKVPEDSYFVAFRIRLDNFKEHTTEERASSFL